MSDYLKVPTVTVSDSLTLETPQPEFYIDAEFELTSGFLPEMLPLRLTILTPSGDREFSVEFEDCFPADSLPDLSIPSTEFRTAALDAQAILHRAICNA